MSSSTDDFHAGSLYRTIKFIMNNPTISSALLSIGNEKPEENTVEYEKKMSNIIRDYVLRERTTELKFKKQTNKYPGFRASGGGFGPGAASTSSGFNSTGEKRPCSHTKDISFCHPVKRPRTNDISEEKSPMVYIRREMAQQKKVDREIAKLEANKEEVSKALDRLKKSENN